MRSIKNKDFDEIYRIHGEYHKTSKGYNKIFLRRNYKLIAKYLSKDLKVLDIGCGEGEIVKYMPIGTKYYGIDSSIHAIRLAKKCPKGCFQVADISRLPFENGTFDAVVSSLTLQYIHPRQWPMALHEVARVLKPSGKFVFSHISNEFVGSKYDKSHYTDRDDRIPTQDSSEISENLSLGGFKIGRIVNTNAPFDFSNYVSIHSGIKFLLYIVKGAIFKSDAYHHIYVSNKIG